MIWERAYKLNVDFRVHVLSVSRNSQKTKI